uniref:Uncharacterized protein n=1 Tax=Calidris pygmaea TaxID=425635 RepID=A0A8C3KK78_9CHAR
TAPITLNFTLLIFLKKCSLPKVPVILLPVGPLKGEQEEIPTWSFWAIRLHPLKRQTKSRGMAGWKPQLFTHRVTCSTWQRNNSSTWSGGRCPCPRHGAWN